MKTEEVKSGQIWQRKDGSRVTLEYVRNGYATYYLTSGSRPQFRGVRIDVLLRRWVLISGPQPTGAMIGPKP